MKNMSRWKWAVAILPLLAMGVGISTPASAVTLYTFTADGSGGTLGSAPWGTVSVSQSGTSLSFDVELAPDHFLNTGAHHSFTFNLSNTTGTIQNISDGATGGLTFAKVAGTSFSNPNFSGFDYAIDCSGTQGSSTCGSFLKFDVANAGSIIGSGGNSSIFFAADITAVNGATGAVGATLTGGGTQGETPLPAALPLFVGGAGFIGLLARRRKQKTAAAA